MLEIELDFRIKVNFLGGKVFLAKNRLFESVNMVYLFINRNPKIGIDGFYIFTTRTAKVNVFPILVKKKFNLQ